METPFIKWGQPSPSPPPPNREPVGRYFNYHDAHPITLMMALLEKFGPECFEWEGDTLKREISITFNSPIISEHNWQKIQAESRQRCQYKWVDKDVFQGSQQGSCVSTLLAALQDHHRRHIVQDHDRRKNKQR